MAVESNVIKYLIGQSAVTAVVGTRVYPNAAPSNQTQPYVVCRLISDVPYKNITGNVGLTVARVQVVVWSQTFGDLDTVHEAVRSVLQNYAGSMGSVTVAWALLDSIGADAPVPPQDNSAVWWYARPADYFVCYRQTVTNTIP